MKLFQDILLFAIFHVFVMTGKLVNHFSGHMGTLKYQNKLYIVTYTLLLYKNNLPMEKLSKTSTFLWTHNFTYSPRYTKLLHSYCGHKHHICTFTDKCLFDGYQCFFFFLSTSQNTQIKPRKSLTKGFMNMPWHTTSKMIPSFFATILLQQIHHVAFVKSLRKKKKSECYGEKAIIVHKVLTCRKNTRMDSNFFVKK